MNNELVLNMNQILRCFSDKRIGVNETIKKTGLARKKGLYTISFLEDANIINKSKDEKHKQRELLGLTNLGEKLALFFERLNEFEVSHKVLEDKIGQHFNIFEKKFFDKKMDLAYLLIDNDLSDYRKESDLLDKQIENILISRGWLKDEVKNFDIWRITSNSILTNLIDLVIEFIIFRYNLFLIQDEINSKAKKLLFEITKSKINDYIHKKIQLIENEYQITNTNSNEDTNTYQNDRVEFMYQRYVCGMIDKTDIPIIHNSENRFIIKEIKTAIINLMAIVNMDKKYLKSRLDSEKKLVGCGIYSKPQEHERKKLIDFYNNILPIS